MQSKPKSLVRFQNKYVCSLISCLQCFSQNIILNFTYSGQCFTMCNCVLIREQNIFISIRNS